MVLFTNLINLVINSLVGIRIFNSPAGLSIDNNDILYCADQGNGWVMSLNSDGSTNMMMIIPQHHLFLNLFMLYL